MGNNIAHSQLTNNWKHLQNDYTVRHNTYRHITHRDVVQARVGLGDLAWQRGKFRGKQPLGFFDFFYTCSSAVSGGYEYDFVDDPILARYQCSICTKVLRDARLTECCGQHFCHSCLGTWLKQRKEKKTCPHCRKKDFVSIINKEKIREIKELRIRCTNREKGYDWVGEMGVLDDHLKSDKGCGYEIVKCGNRGKGCIYELCESLERRHLTNHKENECKYRPYICEYCGHKDTFEGITMGYWMFNGPYQIAHYEKCNEYPLKCPNKCGNNIKRKDMNSHHDICPLESLDCPFNARDCCNKILREDMECHKRECYYRPYSCEYCGHRGTFRDIMCSHYSTCDQYPLECPNKCGETNIKRRDMKAHCDICPLEPLSCPFKDVGCSNKIQRKDMEKHIEINTQCHLMMVSKSHQN